MLHPTPNKLYRYSGPIMGLFFSPNGINTKNKELKKGEVFLFIRLGKGTTYHFLSPNGELGTTFRRPHYWELIKE